MNRCTISSCFGFSRKVSKSKKSSEDETSGKKCLNMVSGARYIPKESDWNSIGEDAHFISAGGNIIGVADGVGSWIREGVDAGEYSRTLMKNSAAASKRQSSGNTLTPKEIIIEAFRSTPVGPGSSTACVVAHNDGKLTSANIGDSRYVVFRRGGDDDKAAPVAKVVAVSEPQLQGFNIPFQLGEGLNPPESAVEMAVAVEEGDVVVLATDGVFDNMYVDEIGALVANAWVWGPVRPRGLAGTIAEYAEIKSRDKSWDSPFAREAKLAGLSRSGGKKDDITVVVGVIVS